MMLTVAMTLMVLVLACTTPLALNCFFISGSADSGEGEAKDDERHE